ncbi:TetR/AcrR family transcriptional regulator [Sphingobacterium sp. Mn56C]|uniref:TetR/AcrR family transcriptional regulator n=1 Tax=Sphingobacterium sp. Mn56C TaxID=3395261 RepID=UPI003BCE1FBA
MNSDDKKIKILETAKRRFSHYGMAKTTMAEIAKDLSYSKALLYYYFPDKNSLYIAVLELVGEELEEETLRAVKRLQSTEKAIDTILNKRMEFVTKYYYILEYTMLMRKSMSSNIDPTLAKGVEKQREIIEKVFAEGVERGELLPMDCAEIARIFLFATFGMRMLAVKDLKQDFIPDKEEFDRILCYQKKLAKIFIRGLKKED